MVGLQYIRAARAGARWCWAPSAWAVVSIRTPDMPAITAAEIGDIAREQYERRIKVQNKKLLAQRRKPVAARKSDGKADVTELELTGRGLTDIGELNFYTNLARLDVSANKLASLDGIADSLELTWLKASGNRLTSLECLQRLTKLKVLNASDNRLEGELRGVAGLTELQALVLSNNQLTAANGLKRLAKLNTLVFSHNRLEKAPPLNGLSSLAKLSLSHNMITIFPVLLGDTAHKLRELRLAHNRITRL